MDIALRGAVACVTGASRGLGRACALALAEAGADLVLTARSEEDLQRTAVEVERHGGRVVTVRADVRDAGAIQGLVERALQAFGRIDVLVNNAGVSGAEKPFLELSAEEWDEVLGVNLRGAALCAQAVGRVMAAQRRGRIINIASLGGMKPLASLSAYCVSKAGLIQLTRVLALELARYNVQVNALCPGYVATPMNRAFFASEAGQEVIRRGIPMRRLAEPAELAAMVVLLASDASSFMTGSVVVADGGHLLT